jgi:hypothetical protein
MAAARAYTLEDVLLARALLNVVQTALGKPDSITVTWTAPRRRVSSESTDRVLVRRVWLYALLHWRENAAYEYDDGRASSMLSLVKIQQITERDWTNIRRDREAVEVLCREDECFAGLVDGICELVEAAAAVFSSRRDVFERGRAAWRRGPRAARSAERGAPPPPTARQLQEAAETEARRVFVEAVLADVQRRRAEQAKRIEESAVDTSEAAAQDGPRGRARLEAAA